MKTPHKIISLLAGTALLAASTLSAATTDPVGYVTETLKPGTFNLLGVNLSDAVAAAGTIDEVVGNTITDNEADFSSLDSGSSYYIKITNGTTELGLNTGLSVGSATTINTEDDLSSVVAAGSTYVIRRALNVSDLFGANNSSELAGANAGDTSSADLIWIPDGAGGYDRIYYNSSARAFPPLSVGWKTIGGGDTDASTTPIYFTSGIIIQVSRSEFGSNENGVDPNDLTKKDLVISGSVQTSQSQVILENGFNPINRVFPSELTLSDSQLELDIAHATAGDTTNADILWVPDSSGGYDRYYYNGTARAFPPLSVGWKSVGGGDADASSDFLSSGIYIERKGSAKMITMRLPSGVTL